MCLLFLFLKIQRAFYLGGKRSQQGRIWTRVAGKRWPKRQFERDPAVDRRGEAAKARAFHSLWFSKENERAVGLAQRQLSGDTTYQILGARVSVYYKQHF